MADNRDRESEQRPDGFKRRHPQGVQQQLKQRLRTGDLTMEEYEQELHRLLKAKLPTHPGQSGLPHTESYSDFEDPRQDKPGPHTQPAVHRTTYSLSFDELPIEQSSKESHPPFHVPSSAMHSTFRPLERPPSDPPPTESLLHSRYKLQRMLSSNTIGSLYEVEDILLEQRCHLHLASNQVVLHPSRRRQFIEHFKEWRQLKLSALTDVYHIEYQPKERLLYALTEGSNGSETLDHRVAALEAQNVPGFSLVEVCSFLSRLVAFLQAYNEKTDRCLTFKLSDFLWQPEAREEPFKLLNLHPFHKGHDGHFDVRVTPADEVFALGNLLYQMLTGRPSELIDQPASRLNPTVPPYVDLLLQSALDPNPEQRPGRAIDVFEAFQEATREHVSMASMSQLPVNQQTHVLQAECSIPAHLSTILNICTNRNGTILMSAARDHQLKWWDPINWRSTHSLTLPHDSLNHATMSPCGRLLAFSKNSHRVEVRYAGDTEALCELSHNTSVQSLLWTEQGSTLLTSTNDCQIHFWSIPTGTKLGKWKDCQSATTAMIATPDGRFMASHHRDCTIKLWSLESKEWLFDMPLTAPLVNTICFLTSPKGAFLVTGQIDGSIRIWDYQTGLCLSERRAHSHEISLLASAPSGQWLFASDAKGDSALWQIDDEGQLYQSFPLERTNETIKNACFLNDGEQLVTAMDNHNLMIWQVPYR